MYFEKQKMNICFMTLLLFVQQYKFYSSVENNNLINLIQEIKENNSNM